MLGEARYWLGDFDEAESRLRKALALADDDDRVTAHAARFLADITVTIRGDDHLAGALFDRSIEAARRLGDPRVLARSLLMAGWVPFWQGRLDDAERVFREALQVARGGGGPDAWAEVRALVGIANVVSLGASEREALAIGREALGVGEGASQPFSIAVAHQVVGASLRRLLRLDEALQHADAAVVGLRELGARWELASALADRGTVHRLRGAAEPAEADLREALVLCRELNDRALVGPTIAELARTLTLNGDVSGARSVLEDPHARAAESQPLTAASLLTAEAAAALAEGDREGALAKSLAALERVAGEPAAQNPSAAARWWTGSLFGAEAAGGDRALTGARETLERNGWRQALREPELVGASA
jgi:MalT-like TPR region/Tetratricopeptide repeat